MTPWGERPAYASRTANFSRESTSGSSVSSASLVQKSNSLAGLAVVGQPPRPAAGGDHAGAEQVRVENDAHAWFAQTFFFACRSCRAVLISIPTSSSEIDGRFRASARVLLFGALHTCCLVR